jgi:hypothetical protein
MTLPLTPEMLACAYDYLCECPPFNKMAMPHSEDVKFSIGRRKDRFAHYQMLGGEHHIVVSGRFVGRHIMLLSTLSHEMAHLYLEQNCIVGSDVHGKPFQRLADKICKHHPEFDRLNF